MHDSQVDIRSPDILVAGAGPAGATIARLLARHGRRVVVVDPETRHVERLEIIAPAACRVIDALGIAPLLDDGSIARACPGIRRRWGTARTETEDFLRRPGGRGFVIDRVPFDQALRQAARESGVSFIAGRVVAARSGAGAMVAKVRSGSDAFEIVAGLLIDATGRPSAVARRMGARRMVSEHLIAERRVAMSRVSDAGWLEVEGDVSRQGQWSYEVSGPNGRSERWAIYPPEQRATVRLGRRADASSALLSHAAGDGWVAIGDAAASFDPVTSQGLANALSTALVAAGAILSPEGFDEAARRIYSDAIAATFHHSEAGRAKVYAALKLAS
jgi:flavin-dependent dehydrogenase